MTSFRENSKRWVRQLEITSAAEVFLFSYKRLFFMLWEWISPGNLNAIYWQSTLFACNDNDWLTDTTFSFASVPGHYTQMKSFCNVPRIFCTLLCCIFTVNCCHNFDKRKCDNTNMKSFYWNGPEILKCPRKCNATRGFKIAVTIFHLFSFCLRGCFDPVWFLSVIQQKDDIPHLSPH